MSHTPSTNDSDLDQLLMDCAEAIDSSFSFAFQPVVDLDTMRIVGHEALVRGLSQESAESVIAAIRPENQYLFDQACRIRALELAIKLNITGLIHLNCSHITPENIDTTLATMKAWAQRCGIEPKRVVLELNDLNAFNCPRQLNDVRKKTRAAGFKLLADRYGASEAGLKRLAVLKPDFVKLDRSLICDIDRSVRRQAIVQGIVATCRMLGVEIIASGVERPEETDWLQNAGIKFGQGFLYARPAFEAAPAVEQARVA